MHAHGHAHVWHGTGRAPRSMHRAIVNCRAVARKAMTAAFSASSRNAMASRIGHRRVIVARDEDVDVPSASLQ